MGTTRPRTKAAVEWLGKRPCRRDWERQGREESDKAADESGSRMAPLATLPLRLGTTRPRTKAAVEWLGKRPCRRDWERQGREESDKAADESGSRMARKATLPLGATRPRGRKRQVRSQRTCR
ncbi:MAG: hypothetical protein COW93_00945 [Parcubacteria group bacterium CG22_combo_CG10-13_8_21_14_all_41_9]|nr:MAG: hypothetical protein COW93_00945 [Parcubacteria group bacterium CG22_combo_CG10-13_8_21_14_all_41_9]